MNMISTVYQSWQSSDKAPTLKLQLTNLNQENNNSSIYELIKIFLKL